ncbi:SIR2 family protein [Gramella sp. MAR_2010_147]|uniref:SIR2 family NAD-dependent protein deacylase n=1 Tax=Gramella sp. MAR_2010_147 TaxID=1250205 RepID=UPI00087DE599|nr:SIR2 family protein [Gramella sp. MAR_2010_147]SDR91379.1 SIR2-like domain-containing protein [Gramella sp. MAR_2010_147]
MSKSKSNVDRNEILEKLAESFIYGNLGLFIGAGMSMDIMNDEWDTKALSWKELINTCAKNFEIDLKSEIKTEGLSYPDIASSLAKIIAENEDITYSAAVKRLKQNIADLTSWYPNKENREDYSKILNKINPNWIITTNYDSIIECLLPDRSISLSPNDQLISPKEIVPIYHLHGVRSNPDSIIITQEDYISLFRPNQYRQQKLALTIKESTTLIIGYGLGDVNVLTALDWTKNVYREQRITYPQDVIQLIKTEIPEFNGYKDHNGITILEFNDLKTILKEIIDFLEIKLEEHNKDQEEIEKIYQEIKSPDEDLVKKFIDDKTYRTNLIKQISENNIQLISGFMELFSKSMEKTWERAQPKNAFFAYDQNLKIHIDILSQIGLEHMPPILLEAIVYQLSRISYFIGDKLGESKAAYKTWNKHNQDIPLETRNEILNICKANNYSFLPSLIRKSIKKKK